MTSQTSISNTSQHYLQPTCSRTLPPTKVKWREGASLPHSLFPLSGGGCYTQATLPKVLHVHVCYLLESTTRCLLKAEAYVLLLKVTVHLPKMLIQLVSKILRGIATFPIMVTAEVYMYVTVNLKNVIPGMLLPQYDRAVFFQYETLQIFLLYFLFQCHLWIKSMHY